MEVADAQADGEANSTNSMVSGSFRNVFDYERAALLQHIARLQQHLSTIPSKHPLAVPVGALPPCVCIIAVGLTYKFDWTRERLSCSVDITDGQLPRCVDETAVSPSH